VDPHVHLRVPGQEHKEDLETGTRAAAAGGFCAVIAMPNTDPVVDSAPVLRGRGAMHEGAVSALLGIAGIPSVSESTMVARDCALAGYEGERIHLQHLSCA